MRIETALPDHASVSLPPDRVFKACRKRAIMHQDRKSSKLVHKKGERVAVARPINIAGENNSRELDVARRAGVDRQQVAAGVGTGDRNLSVVLSFDVSKAMLLTG
jgi:hypothetical protein